MTSGEGLPLGTAMADRRSALEESWRHYRQMVDRRLEDYLQLPSDCPDQLREAMHYSVMAGGKRLRPVLVLLSAEACGAAVRDALPAACAVEFVHTYSLIHDDLPAMDDDALRRGRPTNHVVFGEACAILAGDGLLTLAFEVLARDLPSDVAAGCCVDLSRAAGACGMVGGQIADLAAESSGIQSVRHLESIHRRKTACLLTASMQMGARIARCEPEIRDALTRYGECVGLAFQIADDLLDLTGDEHKMGKGVGKDAAHGKLTYPALLGAEASRVQARTLIDQARECLAPLGKRGQRLDALAEFVVERDH